MNVLDFEHLTFRDQFNQVLNAEIILGLHASPLINAAMARNRSVLLEIMPYRVFHQGFYFAALNAGLTYFLHQCRQGAPQARDFEFEGTSVKGCLNSPDCKDYFMNKRKVDLPREDLLDLGSLLMQARQVRSWTPRKEDDDRVNMKCTARRFAVTLCCRGCTSFPILLMQARHWSVPSVPSVPMTLSCIGLCCTGMRPA